MVAKLSSFGIVITQMGREDDNLGMPRWQRRFVVMIWKCFCDYQGRVP